MRIRIVQRLAAFAAIVAVASAPALAQSARRVQPLVRNGAAESAGHLALLKPNGAAYHAVEGSIASVLPGGFALRTRAGRLLTVNDTVAVKSGRYSMPLFIGKVVLVEGNVDGATFYAARVTRLAHLDPLGQMADR